MKKKRKVFHGLVNYGTQAGMLARGLRKRGWDATSYEWDDSFDREIDFNLKKEMSKIRVIRWFECIFFWYFLPYVEFVEE